MEYKLEKLLTQKGSSGRNVETNVKNNNVEVINLSKFLLVLTLK